MRKKTGKKPPKEGFATVGSATTGSPTGAATTAAATFGGRTGMEEATTGTSGEVVSGGSLHQLPAIADNAEPPPPTIPLASEALGTPSGLVLKRTSAKVIAQQMTYLDTVTFAQIKPEEMLLGNWTRPNKEEVAPTLTYLANYFNKWSYWVSTEIITAGSVHSQAMAVRKFISVLCDLYTLNNFNSLMAIMSGLNRASVSRLKKVWAKVPIRLVELFRQQEEVMSPLNNFKYYRQVLAENRDKKPIIPYLVVFLRDLTFINDGNEERLPIPHKPDVKLPNFEKMLLLGQQILELESYRKVPYTLEEDLAITNALRNVNYLDEDTLHLRSLDQEPLQSSVEVEETETEPANEKKIHNPLLAIQQMREVLASELDYSEGSETWAHDEDKTDDGTSKIEDKSE